MKTDTVPLSPNTMVEEEAAPVLAAVPAAKVNPPVDPRLRGHMLGLDGVRGVAIAMVMVLHFVGDADATNRFEAVVKRVTSFGDLGVDLFFVLSGFLITGILLDAKNRQGYFRSFYMRRALRIFPLYYAVLFVVFFVAPLVPAFRGPDLDAARANQGWAWLYAVNILATVRGSFSLPYLDHFWSLAVEEHFYFVWPLVVWSCTRRTLVKVALGVAVSSLVARAIFAELHAAPDVALYALTPFRLDALCTGGFIAAFARGPDGLSVLARHANTIGIAAGSVLVGTYLFNRFGSRALWDILHQVRSSTFSVIFAAVILRAVTAAKGSPVARFFGTRTLRELGKYSYGLYVFHHFVSYYFIRHKTEYAVAGWVGSHSLAVLLQATLGSLISIGVALLSFHFFESPVLALKRLWPQTGSVREGIPEPDHGVSG
jgi:peptidoglycan/LPS O-acetylase OafA/YrhL